MHKLRIFVHFWGKIMLIKLKIINCFSTMFNFIFQIYISGAQLPEEPCAESASTRLTEGIRRARQTHHRGKLFLFLIIYFFKIQIFRIPTSTERRSVSMAPWECPRKPRTIDTVTLLNSGLLLIFKDLPKISFSSWNSVKLPFISRLLKTRPAKPANWPTEKWFRIEKKSMSSLCFPKRYVAFPAGFGFCVSCFEKSVYRILKFEFSGRVC